MNSIASLDLLMNQPSLIKDLEEITIVSSEMEQIYRWAEDSNRDSSRKFRAERAIKVVMSVYKKVFFSEEKNMAALLKSIFEDGTAATIITNNVINWSIANNYNIEISKYTINPNYYAGIYYELFKFENGYNEELEDILEGKTDYGFIENDFLIVKDIDQPITKENGDKDYAVNSIYRYHNGYL